MNCIETGNRKVSRQLLVDAEREGVKMMATANTMMTEAQSTIDSMDESRLQLKKEYTQATLLGTGMD
jgi:hypothetical protein